MHRPHHGFLGPCPSRFPWLLMLVTWASLAASTALGADASGSAALAEAGFRWSAFLGPFHLLLLHFPIGFIAAAAGLEILAWRRPAPEFGVAIRALLWGAFVSGAAASGAGLLRADQGGFDLEGVQEHRNLAYGFLGVTLAAVIAAHRAGRRPGQPKPVMMYRGLLVLALLLVGVAGHHGGNLTHGSDFLTQGAPPFFAKLMGASPKPDPTPGALPGNSETGTPASPAESSGTQLYSEKIQPLLERRCYACHGPEKHKGDYRLDVREIALRGGDSGSAGISPGDPMKSNLLRVLLLPRDHDDAMPPEGKEALTPEDILAVAHWIQDGAPFATPSAIP